MHGLWLEKGDLGSDAQSHHVLRASGSQESDNC